MNEAYVIDAVRTPIGKRNGTLSTTHPNDLAAHVLAALVERTGVDAEAVEDVVMGCVTQIGRQGWNIGRIAALAAGFPVTVCGTSVNRMCGSSLQTTNFAAQAIMSGQADLVIAAGVENMSTEIMGSDGGDISEKVTERFQIIPQGLSAELIAGQWEIGRDELDEYSWNSHQRALTGQREGWFDNEIVPIEVMSPAGETVVLSVDETPRDSTLEKVASLPPAFMPEGVVTAANSSQICDGAAGLLLASPSAVERFNLTPRARIVSTGLAGVDPKLMLHGNPDAINAALRRAGLGLDDMSVIEVNEAFAVVPLQTLRDLDATDRLADLNPAGGGISLGHPLGASGARILSTMLNELDRRNARYGVASMCIGFGQAAATLVERVA